MNETEKATDRAAIPAYRAIARSAAKVGLIGYSSVIKSLCDRLETSNRALARSGNYVADVECMPTIVWFDNGRVVSVRVEDGRAYLEVQHHPVETP